MSDPGWVPYVAVAGLAVAVVNAGVTQYDRLQKRRGLAIDEWRPFLSELRDVAAMLERTPSVEREEYAVLEAADDRARELRARTNDRKLLALTEHLGENAKWLRLTCNQLGLGLLSGDVEHEHHGRTQARELREQTEAALARLAAVERARG